MITRLIVSRVVLLFFAGRATAISPAAKPKKFATTCIFAMQKCVAFLLTTLRA